MPTFYKGCKRQTIQTYPNIWVLVAIFLCVAKALHFSQCNISEECTWQQSVESFGAHPDWSHCNVSCQKRLQKKCYSTRCYKMLQAFHNCLWILQQTDICWLVSRQNHKPAPKLFCLSRTGSRSCLGGGCKPETLCRASFKCVPIKSCMELQFNLCKANMLKCV